MCADKVELDALDRLTVLELAFEGWLPRFLRDGHPLEYRRTREGTDGIVLDDGWPRWEAGMRGGRALRHVGSGAKENGRVFAVG